MARHQGGYMLSVLTALVFVSSSAHADWGDIFQKSRMELVDAPVGRNPAQIYVPKKQLKEPRPLIVFLHGYGFERERGLHYFNLRGPSADRDALLLVPEGMRAANGNIFWNATDFCCDTDRQNPDDIGYLVSLVEDVKAKYRVDANRIYLFGYSNGAFMANVLSCETHGLFAAVVSFAGGTRKEETKCHQDPISFLQIHADDDQTIRFDHDNRYASGRETYERFYESNRCSDDKTVKNKLNLVKNLPNAESLAFQTSCAANTETALWLIQSRPRMTVGHKPSLQPRFTFEVLDWLFRQRRSQREEREDSGL